MSSQAASLGTDTDGRADSSELLTKPRILLVDDDQTLLDALRRRLRDNFDVHLASDAAEAREALRGQSPFAVIVADMTMPDIDGATLLNEVKQLSPSTVRLMLTGHGERDVVDRAVNDCEVFRFLSKPCRPADLDRALEDAVELHVQWRAAELLESSAAHLARSPRAFPSLRRFDTTSGLPNRRSFEVDLHAALAERDPAAQPSVLIHLDIDNFSVINESRGYATGDALIRHVATNILDALAPEASVARLSTDDFGVLLRGEQATSSPQICKHLLARIADNPLSYEGSRISVSACAGMVPLVAGIEGVTAWLLAAETACATAQRLGPGRIHAAGPEDPQLVRHQSERHWLGRVNEALAENRFELLFQRIVPLDETVKDGLHFELLLRMRHRSGSLISPAYFMPAAERYHLAGALDRWVVQHAFDWLADGGPARLRAIRLASINLSGASFSDPDFIQFLLDLCRARRIPAEKICLEITETAAVADLATAQTMMRDLRQLGFRFALDDFGSGLCSFGYLKNLPVDYLKIDGSFVKQTDRDPTSRALVQAINHIAQVTGKQTVAEFVENEFIMDVMKRIGVNFAQGYGIHRPAPLHSLE